jgi:CheY-like chemotaxis protein
LQRGREAGFDHYLVKPVEGEQLQQALADCNQEASRRNTE